MACRSFVPAFVCGLVIAGVCFPASARESSQAGEQVTLDAVLAAYMSGDTGVVARTFATSLDFQALRLGDPRLLDRWLGGWHRGKAAMLLELANGSTLVAPQYIRPLVGAGRRYLLASRATRTPDRSDEAVARLWHRVAVGLLQRRGTPSMIDEYLEDLHVQPGSGAADDPIDARFVLARAIAQERRCWDVRPTLERPGADVRDLARASGVALRNPGGPGRSALAAEAERWRTCLGEAVARFETAAAAAETQAEARVRGGWMLFQQDDPQQALQWLDAVEPGDDRDVAYWAALFRGRVLDALGRHQAAAEAYRAALAVCPNAQSAGVGLALALFRIDRVDEADALARSLRVHTAAAADPWWIYAGADQRFVDRWIAELRAAVR